MGSPVRPVSELLLRALLCLAFAIAPALAPAQQVVGTLAIGAGAGAVVADPAKDRFFVAAHDANLIALIDGSSRAKFTIPVTGPVALAFEPNTQSVYIATDAGLFQVLESSDVVGTGLVHPVSALAVNPVTREIYALDHAGGFVYVVSAVSEAVSASYPIACPAAVAVNAVTNRAYVTSDCTTKVTVIDGAARTSHAITVPAAPQAIAVNPVTNRVYVAHGGTTGVTWFDGASETPAAVAGAFSSPVAIALNPATNRIFVANFATDDVAVIDGGANTSANVAVAASPNAIAVDGVRNRIYVAGAGGTVSVLDGTTLARTDLAAGTDPASIALNPLTSRVVVANSGSGDATLIDGRVYKQATLDASDVRAAAVNPFTHRAYLAVGGSPGSVKVIDTSTDANAVVATVPVGDDPGALAVDFASNRVYAANLGSDSVSAIDGATNAVTTTLTLGATPGGIAVNAATRKLYVTQPSNGNVLVFDGLDLAATPATVSVGGTPGKIVVDASLGNAFVLTGSQVVAIDPAGVTHSALPAQPNALADFTVIVDGFTYVYAAETAANTVLKYRNGDLDSIITVPNPVALDGDNVTKKVYAATGTTLDEIVSNGVQAGVVTPLAVPDGANTVAVDQVSRRIFVSGNTQVAVLDAASLSLSATVGAITTSLPGRAVVDPVSGKAFVPVPGALASAIVVQEATPPVLANHRPDATYGIGGFTSNTGDPPFVPLPSLSATLCCAYAPADPSIIWVYYGTNGVHGAFNVLGGSGPFSQELGFPAGVTFVTLFASDAMSGTGPVGQGAAFSGAGSLIGAPRVFPVAVVDPPTFVTISLPAGKQGVPYSGFASAHGGIGALSYTVARLPDGLAVSSADGTVSGIPSVAGGSSVIVQVTDASGGFTQVTSFIDVLPGDPQISAATHLDLGTEAVASESSTRGLLVTNNGWSNLVIPSVGISGPAAADFSADRLGCSTPVPPGSSCLLSVTFRPVTAVGARVASLDIASNDPATPTKSVTLTGTAVAVDTTPDFLSFPAVSNVLPGTEVTSNAISITGITAPAPISITGAGAYSIGCDSAARTTAPSTISDRQSVCLFVTSPQTLGASASATLTIGGVSATFTVTTTTGAFRLTVVPQGNGDGAVNIVANGTLLPMNCSTSLPLSNCTAVFPAGTAITLGGNALATSDFDGWTGCDSLVSLAVCSVTMNADRTVTGTFTRLHTYSITIDGNQLNPYIVTSEFGFGTLHYNPSTHVLTYTISINLQDTETATHLHGPADPGADGPIIATLPLGVAKSGTLVLDAAQEAALLANQLYIDIHTTTHPNGALRGQITTNPALTEVVLISPLVTGGRITGTTEAGKVIDCGPTCSATVPFGKAMVLQATPDPGRAFGGWGGACTGTGSCRITVDETKSVFAFFPAPADAPRLGAISTRMPALTGDNVIIGGFVVGGSVPKTVAVRARGPSLASAGVSGVLADPVLTVVNAATREVTTNDNWITAPGQLSALGFSPPDVRESAIMGTFAPGAYTAIVTGAGGTTGVAIVEVFEVDHPETPLAGISTRGEVQGGDNVMIGGFIISGNTPQTVIVRARGPSLAAAGVAGFLANPVLQIVSNQTVIASNDDWQDGPDAALIASDGFAPGDSRESALRLTLPPGAYTAIVSGAGGSTGVGIVEVFAVQ